MQALRFAHCVEPVHLGLHARQLLGLQAESLVDQAELEAGEMGPQAVPASTQAVDFRHQGAVAATVGNQGVEQVKLLLGFEDGLVGTVEVVEVADQGLQARGDLEGLEHMAAHEVGQVAHRLHGDRLVEQLQRLIVFNAEASTEPRRIGRKTVVQLGPQPTQPLA